MAIEAGEIETPDVPHDMNVLLRYVITRDGAVYAAPKEGDTSMPDQHKDIARTYGISVDDIVGSGSIYVSPGMVEVIDCEEGTGPVPTAAAKDLCDLMPEKLIAPRGAEAVRYKPARSRIPTPELVDAWRDLGYAYP